MNTISTTGQLLIDNQWRHGHGDTITSINPATNSIVWEGKAASKQDVDAAIFAGRAAFKEWSRTTLEERLKYIHGFEHQLKQHRDVLTQVIHEETGKPLWETATEVNAMIGKIQISIEAYHERTGSKATDTNGTVTQLQHRPHGLVSVFGPFNFPGHLPNGHIVPALIAGNTVLFKPSELTPKTAEIMIRLWLKTGIPSGVIQLLQGDKSTGIAIADHRDIDGLFFTGSSITGEILLKQNISNLSKILALELGGNNPLIVDSIENIQAAVYHAIQSCFISTGQRCTCARRLIIVDSEQSRHFLNQFIHTAQSLILTRDDPGGFLGPVINLAQAQRLISQQESLLAKGANPLLTLTQPDPELAYVTPGIIDVTDINIPDEEDFGPLVKVIHCADFETALVIANDTRYGLAAGLLSDNEQHWKTFQLSVRAGIVNWNNPTTGASGKAPFGGPGASGNYRPGAYYAADYCAYPMASVATPDLTLPATLSPGITLATQ